MSEETQKQPGSIEVVMLELDIEGTNAHAKVQQYLQKAQSFLTEQQQKEGLDPTVTPTPREITLFEDYAVGLYTLKNTKSHSETLFNAARADIKTYVRATNQNQTDDGIRSC